ncbi:MAG TPA: flagellin lysine-N-methylase [Bryobacteraceae bacterium]|nr:flagellin lysine-N-methylase [Bryobacteraceae bacterium]
MNPSKRLQPRSYHAFRCIGAACEDTCCVGWIVNVDKQTYEAYQRCNDPELGPRLHELVTINTENPSSDSYARIALSGPDCPFLAEGWCAIQKKLGEEYLSIMCSQYPRVMNVVDDVLQRSLDLSCPEAARVMLLDPNPMQFDEEEGPSRDSRRGHLSILRTADVKSAKPYRHFREIRTFVIWLLQYRAYPLWNRLVILGSLCDQLQENVSKRQQEQTLEVLEAYRDGVERNLFADALKTHRPHPAKQLELVLELILGRISSDFTAPRLLSCYQKFMQSMEWTVDSSMDDIGRRYIAAHAQYYEPFLKAHGHMLEHYLVSYVHRTLFPLGPQESTRGPSMHHISHTIRDQYLVMMAHYGIIQMLLVGMAAFHKEEFGAGEAIQVIQSFTKAFEHSPSFPERALKILAEKGVSNCAMLAILLLN